MQDIFFSLKEITDQVATRILMEDERTAKVSSTTVLYYRYS